MPRFHRRILNFFLSFSRLKFVLGLIAWLIRTIPAYLPIQRLFLNQTVVAFFHPQPLYPFHVLVIPRARILTLQAITPADAPLLQECFSVIQHIVSQYSLSLCGYQIIVNGGQYQQFPLLHFHLISERKPYD